MKLPKIGFATPTALTPEARAFSQGAHEERGPAIVGPTVAPAPPAKPTKPVKAKPKPRAARPKAPVAVQPEAPAEAPPKPPTAEPAPHAHLRVTDGPAPQLHLGATDAPATPAPAVPVPQVPVPESTAKTPWADARPDVPKHLNIKFDGVMHAKMKWITDNVPGCKSHQKIIDACLPAFVDWVLANHYSPAPTPVEVEELTATPYKAKAVGQ